MNQSRTWQWVGAIILGGGIALSASAQSNQPPAKNWLPGKAYCVPKETATEGEGYFSIIAGHNGRLYVGTHVNARNAYLVEFDPAAERMKIVVDAMKEIGSSATGFAAQAKIHTRNNVGASGKIYFATKQGYPAKGESRTNYPGGYPMAYDPETGKTTVWPIAFPHQGIISIMPDESRHLAYVSTCADSKPESSHFMVLDLKTQKYKDLIDSEHAFACIVVDYLGRAYHPLRGGDIARYNPDTGKLERLKQTIDGAAPKPESHLADEFSHPITWDVSSDGKTLYAQPMSANQLYAYDLTAKGDTLPGRSVGVLVPTAQGQTDCRGMQVGPHGTVWCAVTVPANEEGRGFRALHLVRYQPKEDKAPVDLGEVYITNPDFTQYKDATGKDLPFHNGFAMLKDGHFVNKVTNLGICETPDGAIYLLELHPFAVVKVVPTKGNWVAGSAK